MQRDIAASQPIDGRTTEPACSSLVSVVTPCFNAAPVVGETIASVRAQTYPHLEHIVVDDGSTDGSWDAITRSGRDIVAVRLPHNRGGCYARNRGAERARGAFLMFLDADDLIEPNTIGALVAAACERPRSIAVCDCKLWKRGPDGHWRDAPRERPVPEPETDLFRAFLEMSAWPPPCCVLWRRDAYQITGGWDEAMARDQDTDILLRAYARGVRIVRTSQGVGYRRRSGNVRAAVSGRFSRAGYRSHVRVIDKLTEELHRLGQFQNYAELVCVNYYHRARIGFQLGFHDLARECLRKGEALGPRVISQKPVGRAVERLLGLERKERVLEILAIWGIATAGRRRIERKRI